jgi:hypothetical protein
VRASYELATIDNPIDVVEVMVILPGPTAA